MAQPIRCDADDCGQLADILIHQVANGDVAGWCFPHYAVICRLIADDAEATARAAAEAAALDAADAALQAEADAEATAAEVAARLAGEHPPEAEALGVARVVPRGTSRTRRQHEARQRAKGRPVDSGATGEDVAAPETAGAAVDAEAGSIAEV